MLYDSLFLLAALLLYFTNVISSESVLTIESYTKPGYDPATPQVSNNGQYDISAGATLILRCKVNGTAALRYITQKYATVSTRHLLVI